MATLKVIEPMKTIGESQYEGEHKFDNGHEVPIYRINSVHDLNQFIGYAKYLNRDYGKVYYRGQCKLYSTMTPSLYHDGTTARSQTKVRKLNLLIKSMLNDEKFMNTLVKDEDEHKGIIIEAILQHYGIPTRCIDAVDNHWVALWFGAYEYYGKKLMGNNQFATYRQRKPVLLDSIGASPNDNCYYQYLILIAANDMLDQSKAKKNHDIFTIDLRRVIPSTYLRPHAQHGIILKKDTPVEHCDISGNVIAILKIRIDNAIEWLGNGKLVNYENLFPSQFHDLGYQLLLNRSDFFSDYPYSIVQYIYD